MKNIYTRIIVICLILMVKLSTLSAQESTTLQFMKGMPQSDLLNPALHNDSSKVVIGLPGLSGFYFDFNSGFAINDLIHKGTGMLADSLVLDIDKFHGKLSSTNTVQQSFSMPLFYLGLQINKSFYSFGITEKEVSQFTFDKSIVTFLKDGNAPYLGQNFDLGSLKMNAFHYREYAFGYSREVIKNKLTVGAKVKALYGKFALQTERMNMKVETAADGSSLNLRSDMKINMSLPATLEYDSLGYLSGINTDKLTLLDYMMQKGNFGMAFDLGGVYQLTSKITLSASIVDIGSISFKKDVNSMTKISDYTWTGIDFSNSIDSINNPNYISPSKLVSQETDKMKHSFLPRQSEVKSDPFKVNIPIKYNIGGTYKINDKFNVGLLDRLYKYGSISRNTMTLSGNAYFGDTFSLTGSYTMAGNTYNNLGLGLAIKEGFMQLYFVSDNILALADPSKARFVNARVGINFLFGRKPHPNPPQKGREQE